MFFFSVGFTPEVRVWEVVFARTGEFEKVNKAFELAGHTSGIYCFDYSPDSARMVSVSKDGTWRLYNTNSNKKNAILLFYNSFNIIFFTSVDYRQGQLATLLVSGKWTKSVGNDAACIALAPDGRVLAIGSGTSLYVYSAASGELLAHIPDVHSGNISIICGHHDCANNRSCVAPIKRLRFDSTSRFILTTGDKYVRVFHNVPGYKIAVIELESKLKKATGQAMKERCQIQLKEAQTLVDLFDSRS